MSANLNAAEVLQGVVSTPAALEAVLNQGAMIVNDYVITIEAVDGGYKLIARRGSDEQAMVILNGVDAPVPDIKITDVVHGHDVTITVGDVAKTFYIHDGVDAPVPEIYVEAVQGGHKVIAAVGDTVKSFTVKDGVDGRDGVDGKDGYTPVKGKDYFDGQPGRDGRDGVDGKNGVDGKTPVKGVDYFDGKEGYTPVKGKDYFDGQPGRDGVSPVINVTDIENGHRVTITTGSDVQSFDVLDGKDGVDAEGGTVEVDPTLSIEGMAADAKATGDAIKAIGSGGGAQVQSDYTQHDASAPDYIKNRPFWPEQSPVLLNEPAKSIATAPDTPVYVFSSFIGREYAPPVEGKRYIFGVYGVNTYTGVAVKGDFEIGGNTFNGIGIVDEQNGNARAVYHTMFGYAQWRVKTPDRDSSGNNYATLGIPIFVIEGDDLYNELSAADDEMEIPSVTAGATAVCNLQTAYENAAIHDRKALRMFEAIKTDTEITIEMGGNEITLPSTSISFVENADLMGAKVDLFMYGEAPLAAILKEGQERYLALLDLKAVGMADIAAKSIKVGYPGIFAPSIDKKQIVNECLPGALIAYANSADNASATLASTPYKGYGAGYSHYTITEIGNALRSGIPMYVCVGDDVNTYYAVIRVEFTQGYAKLWYLYNNMEMCRCETLYP